MPLRVVVLGAGGMLGRHVVAALRAGAATVIAPQASARPSATGPTLDAAAPSVGATLSALLESARPHAVVNCIAVVPQAADAADASHLHTVNGSFPHRVAEAARTVGARVVHIGTDGVFAGTRETYDERAVPDPPDAYGASKLAGEIVGPGALTMRLSIFGPSPRPRGLWNWIHAQPPGATVAGYTDYVFTPISAALAAEAIRELLVRDVQVEGIVHAGGEVVSKYELVRRIAAHRGLDVVVHPVPGPSVTRVLAGDRLWQALGRPRPSLDESLAATDLPHFSALRPSP